MFHTLDAAYSIYPDADDPTSTSTSSTEAQMSEGNMMVWDLAIACGNGRNVKYKGNLRDLQGILSRMCWWGRTKTRPFRTYDQHSGHMISIDAKACLHNEPITAYMSVHEEALVRATILIDILRNQSKLLEDLSGSQNVPAIEAEWIKVQVGEYRNALPLVPTSGPKKKPSPNGWKTYEINVYNEIGKAVVAERRQEIKDIKTFKNNKEDGRGALVDDDGDTVNLVDFTNTEYSKTRLQLGYFWFPAAGKAKIDLQATRDSKKRKRDSDVEEDGNIGRLICFEDKDLDGLEVSYEDIVPVFTEV